MFFKMILALSLLILAACDQFLPGNKKQAPGPITVSSPESLCLQSFPTSLEHFLEDKSSESEHRAAWNCLRINLVRFEKTTRGEHEGGYTAPEVQNFFNDYLLKETPITDGLMEQLMKVKVMIVGGSAEELSRGELAKLLDFIKEFENETWTLHGSMRILLFKGINVSRQQIDDAQKKLNQVFAALLKKTKLLNAHYELRDFKSLLIELQPFLNKTQALDSYLLWFSFVESIKELFMGEKARFISLGDWESALKWSTKAFFSTLEYFYFVEKVDYESPMQWKKAIDWVSGILEIVETAPLMKDKGHLPVENIDKVLDGADNLEILPRLIPLSLLKTSYRKILAYLIEARESNHFDADNLIGFTQSHLRLIRAEFEVWRQTQNFLIHSFGQGNQGKNFSQLAAEAAQYESPSVISSREKSLGLKKEVLQRSWKEWKSILNSPYPLVWRQDQKLYIRAGFATEKTTFKGISILSAIRSMARLILNGYGDHQSPSPFENQISKERFAAFESNFRDLGQNLGMLDSRLLGAAERTFNEANYFSFHGNGDEFLSSMELLEVLNMLFSGGGFIADSVHADLVKSQGCSTGKVDIFKKEVTGEFCFRYLVRNQFSNHINSLPWMASYIRSLPSADFDSFYGDLMEISRLPETHLPHFEYAEIRTATGALQYVEALFAMYDEDQNAKLSADEVMKALPRFKSLLVQISPAKDWMLEEVFLYLLYKGKIPEKTWADIKEAGFFYRDFKKKRLGEIDRGHVLRVMRLIKQETAGTKEKAP